MKDHTIILCVIAFGFGVLVDFLISEYTISDRWRDDAVKHGYAEYYLDDKNERQWRWKDAK